MFCPCHGSVPDCRDPCTLFLLANKLHLKTNIPLFQVKLGCERDNWDWTLMGESAKALSLPTVSSHVLVLAHAAYLINKGATQT